MSPPDMNQLFTEGRYPEAAEEARRRLARNAQDEQALLVSAKVALSQGQTAQADKLISRVTSVPLHREATLVRVTSALLREDWASARDLCLSLTRQPAPPAEAWFGLGLARIALGDAAGARQAQESAVRLLPQRTDFRFELGRALALEKRPREAVHQFVQALRLAPRESRVYAAVAVLLKERGKARLARRVVDAGLKQTPQSPLLLELRGVLEASSPATPASDPHAALLQQAASLLAHKRNRDARKLLVEAWSQGQRSVGLKLLEAEACKGLLPPDLPGARKACEEAIALEPENWSAYNRLGLLLLEEGQRHLPRALELLQEARRRAPSQPEPALNLALAYATGERTAEALELAQATLAALPPDHPLQAPAREFLAALRGG